MLSPDRFARGCEMGHSLRILDTCCPHSPHHSDFCFPLSAVMKKNVRRSVTQCQGHQLPPRCRVTTGVQYWHSSNICFCFHYQPHRHPPCPITALCILLSPHFSSAFTPIPIFTCSLSSLAPVLTPTLSPSFCYSLNVSPSSRSYHLTRWPRRCACS